VSGARDPGAGRREAGDADGVRGVAGHARSHRSQRGTATDTRGNAQSDRYEGYGAAGAPAEGPPSASPTTPLPTERMPQQQGQPYHPPQAYQTSGAMRRPRTGATTTPRTRKARLRVAKLDPWSVMKVSFLLSIALGICTVVAAAVLWMVLDGMGVFYTVGHTISDATGSNTQDGFDLQAYLSLPHVVTFTALIAVIDVVLATALATLATFIYNLSSGFVGGIEVTLAEDE
jgi:hypothetical protein